MRVELPRIGPGEFAAQLEVDSSADRWYRLVLPVDSEPAVVATRIAQEISSVLEQPAVCIDASGGPTELVQCTRQAVLHPMVVFGVDRYTDADWHHVDLLRSQLVGGRTKVLLSGPGVIGQMENFAPNLTSFIGGATWQLDFGADSLSPEEREIRLAALRRAWQQSDDEIVALAIRKALPPEPDFAEWLVLLGRGELL